MDKVPRIQLYTSLMYGFSSGNVLTDADPGVKSKAGFTPLHMAAQEGHEDCVEMLIERGADVNVPANNGEEEEEGMYRDFLSYTNIGKTSVNNTNLS